MRKEKKAGLCDFLLQTAKTFIQK